MAAASIYPARIRGVPDPLLLQNSSADAESEPTRVAVRMVIELLCPFPLNRCSVLARENLMKWVATCLLSFNQLRNRLERLTLANRREGREPAWSIVISN